MSFGLEPGSTFAGYRIESRIGQGGMGVVYLAWDPRLERQVALKILDDALAKDAGFRQRFTRESKLAASLGHPNVVPVFDAGEAEGVLYLSMQYVEGITLKELLHREGRLDPRRSLSIVGQLARALDAAHRRGLIHRDVKPGNVMVLASSDSAVEEQVYLLDFGLTKLSDSNSRLTKTGQFVGTIDYVAPEQIEGKPADGRADVYALGCLLYECLTGKLPYHRDHEAAVIYAHLADPPPMVTATRPELPPEIDKVVAKALSKSPDERYPTAGALVAEARSAVQAGSPTRVQQLPSTEEQTKVDVTAPPHKAPPLAGQTRTPASSDRAEEASLEETSVRETLTQQTPDQQSADKTIPLSRPPPPQSPAKKQPSPPTATRTTRPARQLASSKSRSGIRWIAGLTVLVLVAASIFLVWQRTHGPATSPGQPSTSTGFPTVAEKALLARFPAFVQSQRCHRAAHYEKAIADIECPVSPDHPGATSILFQQFSNYPDLELHYHHVLGLTIKAESDKPLSSVAHTPCTPSAFFAVSNYGPATVEGLTPGVLGQDQVSSPLAHGHLVCYVNHAKVPHIAWTSSGWLIVAQATGVGTGEAAQNGLLAAWEFAGPVNAAAPLVSAPTPESQVSYLYERYLLRGPESPVVIGLWSDYIRANGFANATNAFAASVEASNLVNYGVILPGH